MEARTKSVEDWFSMIREGLLTLPRFQRFEAWRPNQIEGVLENMLRVASFVSFMEMNGTRRATSVITC